MENGGRVIASTIQAIYLNFDKCISCIIYTINYIKSDLTSCNTNKKYGKNDDANNFSLACNGHLAIKC